MGREIGHLVPVEAKHHGNGGAMTAAVETMLWRAEGTFGTGAEMVSFVILIIKEHGGELLSRDRHILGLERRWGRRCRLGGM
jgi:hypothetical protein